MCARTYERTYVCICIRASVLRYTYTCNQLVSYQYVIATYKNPSDEFHVERDSGILITDKLKTPNSYISHVCKMDTHQFIH